MAALSHWDSWLLMFWVLALARIFMISVKAIASDHRRRLDIKKRLEHRGAKNETSLR